MAPKTLTEAPDDVFDDLPLTEVLEDEPVFDPVTSEVVPVPMDLEDVEGGFVGSSPSGADPDDLSVISEPGEVPAPDDEVFPEPEGASDEVEPPADDVSDDGPDKAAEEGATGLIDFDELDDEDVADDADKAPSPSDDGAGKAPDTASDDHLDGGEGPKKKVKWSFKRKMLLAGAVALLAAGGLGIAFSLGGINTQGGYDISGDGGGMSYDGGSPDLGEDIDRPGASSAGSASTAGDTPVGGENLEASQIKDRLSSLTFDGQGLGVNSADVKVTSSDGQVLITEEVDPREDFDYGASVLGAARGAAAVANDLEGDKVDGFTAKRVTWVITDKKGNPKFTIMDTVGSAPDSGDLKSLLLGASGYEIDGEWYSKIRSTTGMSNLSARSGQTPTDLSGAAFGVDTEMPQTSASASTPSSSNSSSSSSGSSSNRSSSSSSSGSSSSLNSSGSSNRSSSSSSSSSSGNSGSSGSSGNSGSTQQQASPTVTTPTQQQTQQQTQTQPQQQQQTQQQQQQTQQQTQQPTQGNSVVETPESSHGATPTAPQKVWVPEKGHMEPVYENVWVPEVTTTKVTRYVCDGCGSKFDSAAECRKHQTKAKDATTSHTVVDTVSKEGGHYERKQTGSHWVVDQAGHWQ